VHIAENAVVQDSVIYDGVVVGKGAVLRRSIVGPNVYIAIGSVLEDQMQF
jgi:ADP-glucose pyrophosphorylase